MLKKSSSLGLFKPSMPIRMPVNCNTILLLFPLTVSDATFPLFFCNFASLSCTIPQPYVFMIPFIFLFISFSLFRLFDVLLVLSQSLIFPSSSSSTRENTSCFYVFLTVFENWVSGFGQLYFPLLWFPDSLFLIPCGFGGTLFISPFIGNFFNLNIY